MPAYAPIKDYAEWYGYACNMENPETPAQEKYKEFHKKHYNSRPYYDFLNDFKGERFDANKWAEVLNILILFLSITMATAFMKQNMHQGSIQLNVPQNVTSLWNLKMQWKALVFVLVFIIQFMNGGILTT